jgi:amino acid permease
MPGRALTLLATAKSNVGIALLTMPFAFRRAGSLGAALVFATAALATLYCMKLLSEVLAAVHGEQLAGMRGSNIVPMEDVREEEIGLIVKAKNRRKKAGFERLDDGAEDDGSELDSAGTPSDASSESDGGNTSSSSLSSSPSLSPSQTPPPVSASASLSSLRAVARAVSPRGSRWSEPVAVLCDVSLFLAMIGACIAYVSFLCSLFARMFGGAPRWPFVLLSIAGFGGVAFVNRIGGVLSRIAAVGVVTLLFGVTVFLGQLLSTSDSSSDSPCSQSDVEVPVVAWATLAEVFGVAAFSNEGIVGLAAPIYADANDRARRWYLVFACCVILGCLMLNSLVGYVGLFCGANPPPDLVTDSLSFSEPVHAVAIVLLMAQIACTFPQVMFVVLQILDERLPEKLRSQRRVHLASRFLVIVATCVAGGVSDNVGALVALFGGLANAVVTFVLPVIFHEVYFFDASAPRVSLKRVANGILVVVAAVAAILATLGAINDLLLVESEPSQDPEGG